MEIENSPQIKKPLSWRLILKYFMLSFSLFYWMSVKLLDADRPWSYVAFLPFGPFAVCPPRVEKFSASLAHPVFKYPLHERTSGLSATKWPALPVGPASRTSASFATAVPKVTLPSLHMQGPWLFHLFGMYSDRQTWANSADPDETAECGVSSASKMFSTSPAIFSVFTVCIRIDRPDQTV